MESLTRWANLVNVLNRDCGLAVLASHIPSAIMLLRQRRELLEKRWRISGPYFGVGVHHGLVNEKLA